MKTSIIALLITAAFASPSLAAGDTTLTTSSKCPEGQYDNGTGGHTYCSRINNNTRDIALSNTAMYGNSERVWEKGVFQGWGKDGKVIVNADGTLAEGASWEDAGLAGRIWYHDGELQTINGKIEIVEKAGQYVITNKAEVAGKIDTAIDNSVTNLINQEGSQLNVAVNGAKETANDFDRRITNNSKDIQTNKAKNEAVWELMFGGQPHFTDSGKFDGFLRAESDKLVVGPNGEFYGYKENAGLYGKITLKTDDHEKRITKNTARIDGNDKRIETLQEVKADKTDLADLEGKGTEAYLELNGKVDNVINGGVLALNTAIKLGDYIRDNSDDIKAGVEGKFNTVIDNSISNVINTEGSKLNVAISGAQEKANDFDERITANKNRIDEQAGRIGKVEDVAANNTKDIKTIKGDIKTINKETARLDEVKADRTELAELENKGNNAYANLDGKITSVEGDINNAKHIAGKVKGAVDVVINNSDTIVDGVNGAINAKVENITNNITGDVLNQIGDIVIDGNSETIVNIKNDISKDVTNQLKLDAKDLAINISKNIANGDNQTVNNIAGKVNAKVDTAKGEFVDLSKQVNQNSTDIAANRVTINNVEVKGESAYNDLNVRKADKADLDAMGDRVTNVEGDISNIKHVAGIAINGKDVAISKAGDVYEGVRNSITNEINSAVDLAVTAIKGDVHNTWENNKGDLAVAINGKYEGAKTEITNNVLNEIGDIAMGDSETIVNIKNDISKDVTNQLKLDAKGAALNIKKDIIEGNNEYANNIHAEYVKAKDAADVVIKDFQAQIDATNAELTAQVSRGEEAAKEANQKALGAFNYMDDKKLDKTDFDDAVNQGKDAYANVNGRIDGAINKGNEELTNINNQFTELNETVNNINAGIEDNSAKLIAMGKAESTRLETDLRNDGQAAYDDLASRIERATSEEEINNILNQYKKDQLAKIQARVNAARPGAEQALADAKDNAKKEANLYVKGKIDQAIADNTQAGKDYVKDEIDNAIAGMVPGANDLDGRIEKIENTINKGKVVLNTAKNQGVNAGKTIVAKAPAVKGAVAGKVSSATTYAKTVNAKADAALVLGYDNSQAIVQERSDRIQGQRDTLNAANSYTDSRFNSLQSQVDSNRKRAASGISGVSAMANIPQLNGDAKFSIGAGIGGFDGEQSLAIGGNARINDNVILRSSISSSTQGEMVWGAGVGFQW